MRKLEKIKRFYNGFIQGWENSAGINDNLWSINGQSVPKMGLNWPFMTLNWDLSPWTWVKIGKNGLKYTKMILYHWYILNVKKVWCVSKVAFYVLTVKCLIASDDQIQFRVHVHLVRVRLNLIFSSSGNSVQPITGTGSVRPPSPIPSYGTLLQSFF